MRDVTPYREAARLRQAEVRRGVARGWSFTPQHGKRCFRKGWHTEPPLDLATLEHCARSANIALRTGSASGVVILDDDTPAQNAAVLLDLPTTPTVQTGSGKKHYYFRQPDFTVRNSGRLLLPNVDVKGERGAATFVGSIHPDTRRMYRWLPSLSPADVPLAELPEGVQARLRPKPAAPRKFTLPPSDTCSDRVKRYASGALRSAALRVYDALEGSRNSTLNSEAFGLTRFVAAGLLARERVEDVLAEAARAAGLADTEILSTLRSALDSGLGAPRSLVLPEVRR